MNRDKSNLFNKNNWCGLIISESAQKRILYLIENKPNILGLRLDIKKSGCAGFIYVLTTVLQEHKDDLIYENNGAKFFIKKDIMPLIDGTKVDYVQEGLNYMFKFNNPKAQNFCGCGISFSL
ncbi:iron-sulfur cluster assembly accessory protein [Candidatus Schneideria nysicola]|uniref:iron-sulfur cluster assembly accessory protein n=1 Tax=Candidatus Schneideria nysicola TaxID=1081631 RepID=UPI001CAA7A09|nr:iron-sulfur cluster assembly accessory protein [Candidatus Schneideria nysicola]UAJ65930.1 iron-sulfur cluster assembly accessory protein [Candidatus Schneideria nysicola]